MTATTATTMRAVVQDGYGDPRDVLRVTDVPRPTPAADEVLVRIRATSVNTPDWITVLGEPGVLRLGAGLRRPRTPIRGTDVAGVVEQVGAEVTAFAPGDEVLGSPWTSGMATRGAFCEYAAVPASMLAHKPTDLSWTDAAVSVMSGLTARKAVRQVADVRPGMTVLVNGASGGVGTFMVQLARSAGASVTGVCSSRNAELVSSLGADHVIDYTTTGLGDLDNRYDVVIDNALSQPFAVIARLVAPGGMLVPNSAGSGSRLFGGIPRLLWTSLRASASRLRWATVSYEVTTAALTDVATQVARGELRAVVDSVHDLADVPAAVARMASRRAVGNVAVVVP